MNWSVDENVVTRSSQECNPVFPLGAKVPYLLTQCLQQLPTEIPENKEQCELKQALRNQRVRRVYTSFSLPTDQ